MPLLELWLHQHSDVAELGSADDREAAACNICGGNGHGPWACPFAADNEPDVPSGASQPAAPAGPRDRQPPSASDPFHGVYGNCVDFISSECADDEEIKVRLSFRIHLDFD